MHRKVIAGRVYRYVPVGLDLWDSRARVPAGTLVRVVALPGCPPPNTMGHAHIETADTGTFAGLVLTNSLEPVVRDTAASHRRLLDAAVASGHVRIIGVH